MQAATYRLTAASLSALFCTAAAAAVPCRLSRMSWRGCRPAWLLMRQHSHSSCRPLRHDGRRPSGSCRYGCCCCCCCCGHHFKLTHTTIAKSAHALRPPSWSPPASCFPLHAPHMPISRSNPWVNYKHTHPLSPPLPAQAREDKVASHEASLTATQEALTAQQGAVQVSRRDVHRAQAARCCHWPCTMCLLHPLAGLVAFTGPAPPFPWCWPSSFH
jgi:hypothetical protein